MAQVIRTQALILRHSDDRERDRFLMVLTPTLGKMQIRARGTKASTSKLGGSLEPLTEVDLTLANGRTVDVVTGSVILQRWPELRHELVASVSAQWLLELIERVTKPSQPEQGLYPLVIAMLDEMKLELSWPYGRRWLALLHRAWRILQQEGFAPALDQCGRCHRKLSPTEVAIDPRYGFVHQHEKSDQAVDLGPETIQYLGMPHTPSDVRRVFEQVRRVIDFLLTHVLDQPLRTEKVLRSVWRLERLSSAV